MLKLRDLRLDQVSTLLCDADGNLFPSEEPAFEASTQVTNRFLQSIGSTRSFTATELRLSSMGRNFRAIMIDLARECATPLDDATATQWVAEEAEVVTAHLGQVLRPDDRVRQALSILADRYSLAVVSSSALVRLSTCFTVTGLDDLFPVADRFSAQDSLPMPTSKPDPAVYLHAASQLGLGPDQVLAVEDAVAGVQSAVGAGFQTVGNVMFVAPEERETRTRDLMDAGVSAVVGSWKELTDLLAATTIGAGT